MKTKLCLYVLISGLFGLTTLTAQVITNTWTGGGANTDWRNEANWTEGNVFSQNVIAEFNSSPAGIIYVSATPTIRGLRYTENVGGSQIRLTNTPTGTAARSLLFWSGSNDPRVGTTIEVASNGNNLIGSGGFGTVQFVNDVEFNLSNPTGTGWTSVAAAVINQNLGPIHITKNGTGDLFFSNSINTKGDLIINAGKVTLQGASTMNFVIGDDGVNNSITGSGIADLQGAFAFDLTEASTVVGSSWNIVDVGSGLTSIFQPSFSVTGFTNEGAGIWTLDNSGTTYQFSQTTGDLSVIPEPGTYALLLGLAAITCLVVRRTRTNTLNI